MNSEKPKIGTLFIIIFSLAVVALGAQELNKKYARQKVVPSNSLDSVLTELSEVNDVNKASLSPKALENQENRDTLRQQDKRRLKGLLKQVVPDWARAKD